LTFNQGVTGSNPVRPILSRVNIAILRPGQVDQPYFKHIDQSVTIPLMQGYTLREAAEALGVSMITIRRYIKSGKLKARLVPSKFGDSYIIEDLPLPAEPSLDDAQQVQPLINRIEQLSQEVGYWKARAEILQERLLLLEAPRQPAKQAWWLRLFRRTQRPDKVTS
jgi:excisionase family DNA binding protein